MEKESETEIENERRKREVRRERRKRKQRKEGRKVYTRVGLNEKRSRGCGCGG